MIRRQDLRTSFPTLRTGRPCHAPCSPDAVAALRLLAGALFLAGGLGACSKETTVEIDLGWSSANPLILRTPTLSLWSSQGGPLEEHTRSNAGAGATTLTAALPEGEITLAVRVYPPDSDTILLEAQKTVTLVAGGNDITFVASDFGDTSAYSRWFFGCAPDGACSRALSAGGEHTCSLDLEGVLRCFGNNRHGELGDPSVVDTGVATIATPSTWRAVDAGETSTCGITTAGSLYCWGDGALGSTVSGTSATPQEADLDGLVGVTVGAYHACAWRADGTLYCWGYSDLGQVGHGSTSFTDVPVQVGTGFSQVSAGSSQTCGIRSSELYCWGDVQLSGTDSGSDVLTPTRVGTDNDWGLVSAGINHTCALKTDGRAYCWGHGPDATGTGASLTQTPVAVASDYRFITLNAGQAVTCGISRAGERVCWGQQLHGRLGNGVARNAAIGPTLVDTNTNWGLVSAGNGHACGTRPGQLACWGRAGNGQLGGAAAPASPTLIVPDIRTLVAGRAATCWVPDAAPSTVRCIGALSQDLGATDDLTDAENPRTYTVPGGVTVTALDSHYQHLCASVADAFSCWGDNSSQEVRVGGAAAYADPPVPEAATGLTQLSTGGNHTCHRRDRTLRCFGDNGVQQLGGGAGLSDNAVTYPDNHWDAVAAGGRHSCGIVGSGAGGIPGLYCFGANDRSQMGGGSASATSNSARVGSDADWTDVVSGEDFSCGVRASNIYCWGAILVSPGQDGPLLTPTAVLPAAATSITQLTAGFGHACAVVDGEVLCFGDNTYGALGDRSVASGTRQTIPGMGGADMLSAGGTHTCARLSGDLHCWGNGEEGQLAIPTWETLPVAVTLP